MTLPQARVILENYLTQLETCEPSLHTPEGLGEALRLAISTLPKERRRETAKDRLDQYIATIKLAKGGFDPFADKTRDRRFVCWRQCVWLLLARAGFMHTEIARATGYDHATVWWGISRLKGYLAQGDYLAVAIWNEITSIIRQ